MTTEIGEFSRMIEAALRCYILLELVGSPSGSDKHLLLEQFSAAA